MNAAHLLRLAALAAIAGGPVAPAWSQAAPPVPAAPGIPAPAAPSAPGAAGAAPVASPSVALSGILGRKALLVVDGTAPRAVGVGESHMGVTVVAVGRDDASVDVAGERRRLLLGEAPVSIRSARAGQRIVLQADSTGHFGSAGAINGRVMQFIVDTGASYVGIGQPDAERMGLPFMNGQPVVMNTANGRAQGWRLKLDSVRIGDVEMRGVDAVVTPMAMPYVLLGNSFLSEFQMTRAGGEMVLERRR